MAAGAASKGQLSVPGTDARACTTTADPATIPTGYSTASASPDNAFRNAVATLRNATTAICSIVPRMGKTF